jgi:hypothetical protein
VEARVRCVMMLQAATVNATVGLMVGFTADGELTPLVVEVMDEDEGYSSPACERLQPTGLRVSDGSWHYVALTYGDTTATVDSAEAAAVTLPAKLQGDLMFVSLHAGHSHSARRVARVGLRLHRRQMAAMAGAAALQTYRLSAARLRLGHGYGVAENVVGSSSRWQIAERGALPHPSTPCAALATRRCRWASWRSRRERCCVRGLHLSET